MKKRKKIQLIIDLYMPVVKDGELITAYEPMAVHKDFIEQNKELIIKQIPKSYKRSY